MGYEEIPMDMKYPQENSGQKSGPVIRDG